MFLPSAHNVGELRVGEVKVKVFCVRFENNYIHLFSIFFNTFRLLFQGFFKERGQAVQRHEEARRENTVQKLCRTLRKASFAVYGLKQH